MVRSGLLKAREALLESLCLLDEYLQAIENEGMEAEIAVAFLDAGLQHLEIELDSLGWVKESDG
jgi:hypothetical protein